MAVRDALLIPEEKYARRAFAHGTLSPAVNAARCSSPLYGSLVSSSISWNTLHKTHREETITKALASRP